jgi:uncharacterized NAD-dependent epimerase/dehydratase family protein
MANLELIYVVDAWHRHAGHSLQGFPREIDSLREFRSLIEDLKNAKVRDIVVRLYTRSGKNEVTQITEWLG